MCVRGVETTLVVVDGRSTYEDNNWHYVLQVNLVEMHRVYG